MKHVDQQVSLSSLLTNNALVIMLALVLAAGFIWYQFTDFLEQLEQQSAEAVVQDKAELLATRLTIYHDIVASLSRNLEVSYMLDMQADDLAAQWAIKNAALLPDILGLALVTPYGKVLGNPPELKIGPRCLNDMRHQIQGLPVTDPPVHTGVLNMEHFDVTEVVKDPSGERIGLLLASFKLTTIQSMLDGWSKDLRQIRILDKGGQQLLAAGSGEVTPDAIYVIRPVPGTTWLLGAHIPKENKLALLTAFTATGVIAVAFILLILILMMQRIRHSIQRDYNEIFTALEQVSHGQECSRELNPRLQETAHIISSARNIRQQQEELHDLSLKDELTGIANRRMFNKQLPEYFEQAQVGIPVAMIMLDLDSFKDMNDRYGHDAGDETLRLFARLLSSHVRQTDLAARFGGDEFIFLQIDTSSESIRQWHQRLCGHFMEAQKTLFPDYNETRVTCSAGFSFIRPEIDKDGNDTLKRTDQALYQAKDTNKADIVEA